MDVYDDGISPYSDDASVCDQALVDNYFRRYREPPEIRGQLRAYFVVQKHRLPASLLEPLMLAFEEMLKGFSLYDIDVAFKIFKNKGVGMPMPADILEIIYSSYPKLVSAG